MTVILQAFVAIVCVVLLWFVVRLVARGSLLLKYSLLWILLGVAALICALFPQCLFALSSLFGFASPSNFIFFIGLFCLLAIALSLSVIVSRQTVKIKNLTQRLALIEHEASFGQKEQSNVEEVQKPSPGVAALKVSDRH